jgi:signal transduction histidine kinase
MTIDPVKVHRLKNKLAIILGFCELMLLEAISDDQRRADLLQIQDAAKSALDELPPLPAHEFVSALTKPEAARED